MKKVIIFLVAVLAIIACKDEPRFSISFDENYITSSTQDFLLLDEFYDYSFMPRFNNVKSIRYKVSEAEMKFGEYVAGNICAIYDFEYSNNLLNKITCYDEDGDIYLTSHYEYNDDQNIKHELIYDEDGMLIKYSYKYAPNKIIVNEKYDENEAGEDLIIILDDSNKVVERYWQDDETDKVIVTYGRNSKVSVLSNPEREQFVEFKYDYNNRISEISPWGLKFFYNGELLSYVESHDDNRKIEYIYDSSNIPSRVLFKNNDNSGLKGKIIDILVEFNE